MGGALRQRTLLPGALPALDILAASSLFRPRSRPCFVMSLAAALSL